MKVIEFFGMPRSGKTEQIKQLTSYLDRKGLRYLVIADREIEKDINVPLTKAFEYNILFFNEILKKFLEAKHSKKYDIIILDRGFLDGEVWFNVEHKQKNLSDSDKELAIQYLDKLKRYIDVGIFIGIEPSKTLERHEKKGEVGKADDYVLKTYIEDLYLEYMQLKEKFKGNEKIVILDGNEPIDVLHLRIKDKLHEEKAFDKRNSLLNNPS